jgi:hypothetical protein
VKIVTGVRVVKDDDDEKNARSSEEEEGKCGAGVVL